MPNILEFVKNIKNTTMVESTTATTSTTTMTPLMHHFWKTCITWGIPFCFAGVSLVGGIVVLGNLGKFISMGDDEEDEDVDEDDDKDGDGDKPNNSKKKNGSKNKNPVTELYNDLYGTDESKKKDKRPIEEIIDLFKELFASPGNNKNKLKAIKQRNRGIPPLQYITMRHWNKKLDSYRYSMTAATQSKAQAAAQYRAQNFDRALSTVISETPFPSASSSFDPSPHRKRKLLELEKDFLREGSKLQQSIQTHQTSLTRETIDNEMKRMGVSPFELDPNNNKKDTDGEDDDTKNNNKAPEKDATSGGDDSKEKKKNEENSTALLEKLNKKQKEIMELELRFVRDVVAVVGVERATGIRVALLGDIAARGSGGLLTQLKERPLSVILGAIDSDDDNNNNSIGGESNDDNKQSDSKQDNNDDDSGTTENNNKPPASSSSTTTPDRSYSRRRRHLFVTRFAGDLMASQVTKLREEITAIIRNSRPGDEALVVLESGGGTVTGYGLAAGQLQRLKENNMRLTIVVEQVAASGGYMMCCIGDKIVGSPFAAFGSIGVLTEIPNFYNRLQREGVEFQTVTAGKYKRTITPFKEVTDEDFEKTKENLEDILTMFRSFVRENRPQLTEDIEEIATGEVWFGTDALEKKLCDEIKTADDVLLEYVDGGWDVFEVEYKNPQKKPSVAQQLFSENEEERHRGGGGGIAEKTVRWFVRILVSELTSSCGGIALGGDESQPRWVSEQQQQQQQQHKIPAAYYGGANRVRTQSSTL